MVLQYCVGFDEEKTGVTNADTFIAYVKKCQVTTTFFFMVERRRWRSS